VIIALFGVAVVFSAYAVLLRVRHNRRDRLWEELSARWEQPVLAAIMDPEAIPAAQALVDEKHELHFVHFVLEYSRRVRGAERAVLRTLVEPFLPEIGRRARHRNSEVRTRAMQTLGTLGLPKYSAEVLAGLDDPSQLVCFVAARYLARREFPEYGPAVLEKLERFEGQNPRFLASMLAAVGPTISPELRSRMSDPERPSWERAVLVEALAMQLDPQGGDAAAEALAQTDDRALSLSLLRYLGVVGRPDHLDVIRERCESDDLFVRAQAMSTLGMVGDEHDLPLLIAGMDDDSPWAALHAARGVKAAGGSSMLFEMATSDRDYAPLAGQVLYEEAEP